MRIISTAIFLVLLLSVPALHADTLLEHSALEYSIYLPDNWIMVEHSDSQHYFYDTTLTFGAQLSIVRHTRVAADFPTAEDWIRAHFIAYKIVTENSADPWGAVLYYDSAQTSTQDGLWAPEIYTTFFSLDTIPGAWSEYSRFCAFDNYGFDLYALGDTADMLANLGTYAAILQGIEFTALTATRGNGPAFPAPARQSHVTAIHATMQDLLGRALPYARSRICVHAAGVRVGVTGRSQLTLR
jgi:hypothetical protein